MSEQVKYKDLVPKGFWHDSEPTPVAYTVGELINVLNQLPPELDVKTSFTDGVMVVLYNIDSDGMSVEITEVEPDDDADYFGDDE